MEGNVVASSAGLKGDEGGIKLSEKVSIFVDGPQINGMNKYLKDIGKAIVPRELLYHLLGTRVLHSAKWYQPLKPMDTERADWLYQYVSLDRLYDLTTSDEGDIDVELAVDLVEEAFLGKVDTIVLVSGDGDFLKPIRIAKEQGMRVEVAGSNKIGDTHMSLFLIREAHQVVELHDLLGKIAVKV